MPINKKTAGIAAAAGALAIATGVGVAGLAQAEPTPSPGAPSASPSSGQSADPSRPDGRGGPHGRGGGFGADVKQLAEKLGVTEAKVIEALEAIREERKANRPSTPPSTPPSQQDRDAREAELAKALAEELGVDQAKVQAALDEIQAARQADRAAALKERLDAAVKDGTLTQAEADAVTKAHELGVIGGPR